MTNSTMPAMVKTMLNELKELTIVYGYMLQNAPTEESRRIVELNLQTVRMTKETLMDIYRVLSGETYAPIADPILELPVFTTFMEAARYAFFKETQLIRRVKDLYLMTDHCYRDQLFNIIVEHQLNAMRLLYLDTL